MIEKERILIQSPLLAFLLWGVSWFFLSSSYQGLGLVLAVLVFLRLWQIQNKKEHLLLVIICLFASFLLLEEKKIIEAPFQEQEVSWLVKPKWETKEEEENQMSLIVEYKNQEYQLWLPKKKVPSTPFSYWQIKGVVQNGQKARFQHGFHERLYFRGKHLAGKIMGKDVTVCSPFLPSWRQRIQLWIQKKVHAFPSCTQKYINQLLLGKNMTEGEVKKAYRQLGVIHLLSLSGLQVLLMVWVVRKILWQCHLPREITFFCELVLLWNIYWFCGQGIGIIRSGLQYIFLRIFQHFSLKPTLYETWSLAFCCHWLFCPSLGLQVGAVLSYLLSLFAYFCFYEKEKHGSLLFFFLLCLVMARFFFEVSIWSTFWNFIFAPLFTYLLIPFLFGYFFIFSFFSFAPLQQLVENALRQLDQLVVFGNQYNFSLTLKPFSSILLCLCLVTFLWYWQRSFFQQKTKGLWWMLLLLFILNPCTLKKEMNVIDIGQGDAILFSGSHYAQEHYLVDCGGKIGQQGPRREDAERNLIPFLKSKGVWKIKTLFITHADWDHMGNMVALAKNFQVEQVMYSLGCDKKSTFAREKAAWQKIQPKTKFVPLVAGKQEKNQTLTWKTLWPKEEGSGRNEDSLILQVHLGKRKCLLLGDAPKEVENQLPSLTTDFIKLGHHGSHTSSDENCLRAWKPKIALISCGYHNRFHHPHSEVLATLKKEKIPYYRTDLQGTITYQVSLLGKEKIQVAIP